MYKFLFTGFLFLVAGWAAVQTEKVTAFTFETYTRGYRKTILIRSDSTFIEEQNQPGKKIERKTTGTEWAKLLHAIAAYKLTELINLPAPTNNRSRDAARTSNIVIKTKQRTYNSGFFDDEKPNLKLIALLKAINQTEKIKT